MVFASLEQFFTWSGLLYLLILSDPFYLVFGILCTVLCVGISELQSELSAALGYVYGLVSVFTTASLSNIIIKKEAFMQLTRTSFQT